MTVVDAMGVGFAVVTVTGGNCAAALVVVLTTTEGAGVVLVVRGGDVVVGFGRESAYAIEPNIWTIKCCKLSHFSVL